MSRFWLGSIAEGVVREVVVPVLLVKPDETAIESAAGRAISQEHFRRVLVPLDGSLLAEAILEPALGVVGEDGDFALVHVVEPITTIAVPSLAGIVAPRRDESEKRAGEIGDYVESVAARLRARGLTVRTRVIIQTQAWRAILEHAREIEADLIAMATHGRGGLRRLLLGSVADKVLRGAETAVLLYRPHAE